MSEVQLETNKDRTHRLPVLLTPGELARIRRHAEAEGVSMAELIRDTVLGGFNCVEFCFQCGSNRTSTQDSEGRPLCQACVEKAEARSPPMKMTA